MVDDHCFFFFEGPKFHVHHSSFEVHDFDSQLLGHNWLMRRHMKIVGELGTCGGEPDFRLLV